MSLSLGIGLGLGRQRQGILDVEWLPTDLANLQIWLDPSDLSTMWTTDAKTTQVASDGDPVGYWADKSGNGFDISIPTATHRPVYKTSSGLHWIEFDGVDDRLETSTVDIGVATSIVGCNVKTGTDSSAGLLTNATDQGTDLDFVFSRDAANSLWNAIQDEGKGLADSSHFWNNQIQTSSITFDAAKIYSADGSDNAATNLSFPTGLIIGRDRGLASRFLVGSVYGVITAGSTAAQILSTADRNAAEEYLATKAGITL